MAVNFPGSPINGQQFTANGITYEWNSASSLWEISLVTIPADVSELGDSQGLLSGGGSAGEGITAYTNASDLPMIGVNTGAMAFVTSTNSLYIWNGSTWYGLSVVANSSPSLSGASPSYTLATDGTATVVTLTGTDTDGTPLTYSYSVTSGSLTNGGGATATVTQNGNVFTITPTTTDTYAGTFELTFTVSDGEASATASSSFELSFATAATWYGDRALSFGGNENSLEYFSITTSGNAASFGNMLRTGASNMENGVGDGTYGLLGVNGHISACSTIDYVTVATPANAVNYGDLSSVRSGTAACSDGTYGVWGGGEQVSGSYSRLNTIDYLTIQSGGTAQDFGDLSVTKYLTGSLSDGIYGVWGGGRSGSNADLNTMEYVTVATTSNASSFGNLSVARRYASGIGGRTYGYFAGAYSWPPSNNSIDYITVATPSNSTDFGDLVTASYNSSGTGNETYGVWSGGMTSSQTTTNVIQRFTQGTSGNCTDFGDLLAANNNQGSVSGSPS